MWFVDLLKQWHLRRSLCIVVPIACLMAGTQYGLVIALRKAKECELRWPIILMAVLSASLLAAGVLRHYWDIYTHRTVRGISFLFVGIDAAGDLFSLISILFQPSVDILGMVIYGVELTLWIGVFVCGGYYNFRPWAMAKLETRRRRQRSNEEAPRVILDDTTMQPPTNQRGIALHDMPSSTSVFRTPSNEIARLRMRGVDAGMPA